MNLRTTLSATAVVAALALTACGSSGNGNATTSASPAVHPVTSTIQTHTKTITAPKSTPVVPKKKPIHRASNHFVIDASEFSFEPSRLKVKAGKVLLTLKNDGKLPHELVLLKAGQTVGPLQIDPKTNRVSEAGSVGRIAKIDAHASATTTLHLKRGTYIYVCNIPGHYKLGMRGVLTVS